MSFLEFASAPNVWPFGLALLLFFIFTGLEIVLALIGIGSDFGLDTDLDLDVEVPESSWLTHIFDWLGLGRVPYLVTLCGFLLIIGISGLSVQNHRLENGNDPWPGWLVMLGCVAVSIPVMRVVNHLLGKVWPKDVETSALTQDALIGQPAEITMGEIGTENSGQIKVRDPNGTTHYVLAVASLETERFAPGDQVIVVGRQGQKYTVRRNPLPSKASE